MSKTAYHLQQKGFVWGVHFDINDYEAYGRDRFIDNYYMGSNRHVFRTQ